MPDLFLVGGPNGVGKSKNSTALTEWHDIPVIDGDKIIKELQIKGSPLFSAEKIIQDRIMDHLKNNRTFVIESNLDTPSAYGFAHYAKENDYKTHLIYLGVDDQNILNKRISDRTKLGLHYISPPQVKAKYQAA